MKKLFAIIGNFFKAIGSMFDSLLGRDTKYTTITVNGMEIKTPSSSLSYADVEELYSVVKGSWPSGLLTITFSGASGSGSIVKGEYITVEAGMIINASVT